MPEYLSPGVYVEEIDAGPKPIEGVSTSTAGAVGVTLRGPTRGRRGPFTGKPELVTSFAEFVRKFGGYIPEPSAAEVNRWTFNANEGGRWWHFPLAVKGFFTTVVNAYTSSGYIAAPPSPHRQYSGRELFPTFLMTPQPRIQRFACDT